MLNIEMRPSVKPLCTRDNAYTFVSKSQGEFKLGYAFFFTNFCYIFAFIQFVFFGGLGAGAAAAEKTGNPVFGIIVSAAILVIVGWAITACVG